jgi:nuclear factor related to kappa-B-binding protein
MNYDSESSDATILSSNGIDESAADNCEIAKILDLKIQLPQDLCENNDIFQELFSISTWNTLTPKEKEHLSAFLPEFPERNEQERNTTIHQLFTNKITRFGTSPLGSFHNNLQDGNYRPDIAQYRKQILKAEAREQRIRMCERISLLAEKLVLSREKLLRSVYSSSPEVLNTESISKQLSTVVAMRGSKRYAHELSLIKASGDGASQLDDKSHLKLSKRQIKQLDEMVIMMIEVYSGVAC